MKGREAVDASVAAEDSAAAAMRPCPICSRPAKPASRPFCSPRCARVDLNRWLSGVYRIPGEPLSEDADSADQDAGG